MSAQGSQSEYRIPPAEAGTMTWEEATVPEQETVADRNAEHIVLGYN